MRNQTELSEHNYECNLNIELIQCNNNKQLQNRTILCALSSDYTHTHSHKGAASETVSAHDVSIVEAQVIESE